MELVLTILGYAVEGFVRWLLYSIILWIMIKIQKLNYTWWGFLLVSGAAIAISYVPYAGPYLAYPVLIFGLHKVTGAEIVPDIIFTVAITRAVMFCVNLFIIGALMGDLRPDLNAAAREGDEAEEMEQFEEMDEDAGEPARQAVSGSQLKASDLSLRGISISSTKATAMVSAGRNFHTISTGECFLVQSAQSTNKVRCDTITKSFVLLTVDGKEQIKLQILQKSAEAAAQ